MSLPSKTTLTGHNNKYSIVETVGQGGFGIVYEATDSKGNKVAVKEYFPSMLATRVEGSTQVNPNTGAPEALELFNGQKKRFIQEADHMKKFNDDPRIVDVFDCFEENGTAYIVMEFVKGKTLAHVLSKFPDKRLPLDNVIKDLTPIAEVLEEIHKTNLIHRDISPYNIMFAGKKTKLLDFGAARLVSPGGKFTLTAIVNKPYSPPEQFQEFDAEKLQGTWSDVYALAATIYHAITGHLAPHANQREFAAYHQNKNILKSPSSFGIPITPQQEAALLKGLALRIEDRYKTINEFFTALKGATPPPPPTTKTTPPPPPNTKMECPFCHHFYDSTLPKCDNPDCPSNAPATSKRPWIAAAGAVLLAAASFSYAHSSQAALDEIAQEAKELKSQASKYDYISNSFGYGSSAYYADIPVLVLSKDGDEGEIPVYWSNWGNAQTTELDAKISSSKDIHVEWANEVTNQRRNAVVTSGSESGAYIVHFSNEKTNDAFDVLVVVE